MENNSENSTLLLQNNNQWQQALKQYPDVLKPLEINHEQVIKIMNLPQRTEEWLQARQGRITASNYGAAVGHNPYTSAKKLVIEALWKTFQGNAYTQWGNDHEDEAAHVYKRFLDKYFPHEFYHIHFPGLIVNRHNPWVACSPDGLPVQFVYDKKTGQVKHIRFLLEIKCPGRKQLYDAIPPYYFDQIQGIMGILNLPWCDFVVWIPEKTQIRRFKFDQTYFEQYLYPQLQKFYFDQYLPEYVKQQRGETTGPPTPIRKTSTPKIIHQVKKPVYSINDQSFPFLQKNNYKIVLE